MTGGGQQAIRIAINQRDGIIEDNILANSVWQRFDQESGQLIAWSQQASSGHYGEFAPLVIEAFHQHDPHAICIVKQQIDLLSRQIAVLLKNNLLSLQMYQRIKAYLELKQIYLIILMT